VLASERCGLPLGRAQGLFELSFQLLRPLAQPLVFLFLSFEMFQDPLPFFQGWQPVGDPRLVLLCQASDCACQPAMARTIRSQVPSG
jgi:hypothetical protein